MTPTSKCCDTCLPEKKVKWCPRGGFKREDGTRYCGISCECHWKKEHLPTESNKPTPTTDSKNSSGKCSNCGASEIPADTARTVYACGSSDYDQRPGTFEQKCHATPNSSEDWEKRFRRDFSCEITEDGINPAYIVRIGKEGLYSIDALLEDIEDFIRREIQEERRETVEFIRAKTKSETRKVRIGENGLAMRELNISMRDIELHNSHCDGFEEGWQKKTEQVNTALEAALETPKDHE